MVSTATKNNYIAHFKRKKSSKNRRKTALGVFFKVLKAGMLLSFPLNHHSQLCEETLSRSPKRRRLEGQLERLQLHTEELRESVKAGAAAEEVWWL